MRSLVIVEHDHNTLHPATVAAINAASQLTDQITLLVIGYNCSEVANLAANMPLVTKVLYLDHKKYQYLLAENITPIIVQIVANNRESYQYVLCSATAFGKNILPRVAACLDCEQVSEVTKIIAEDTFERFLYSGNAIQTVKLLDNIKCLTIRPKYFINGLTDRLIEHKNANNVVNIEKLNYVNFSASAEAIASKIEFLEFIKSSQQLELTSASIVVAGGRALQTKENFKLLIEQLANKLHAAIGATRTAVHAGFVDNDAQIGFSGKSIAPELYIAIGISGAIQHISGIKDSKIIVAINKDENAPIFQWADYKIVGDLFKIVPELIDKL